MQQTTEAKNFYPTLHTLRGLAALWVSLLHIWYFSGAEPIFLADFLTLGWVGVSLFYALSAFLFGLIYFKQEPLEGNAIKRFYKKRFFRIFPAYYAQLLIILLLTPTDWYDMPSFKDLFSHLFLYFNLPPFNTKQLNGVWWTLQVEFQFYLIFPFLLVFIKKFGITAFVVVSVVLTTCYRLYLFYYLGYSSEAKATTYGQLPGIFTTFCFGMLAAYLATHSAFNFNRTILKIVSTLAFALWLNAILHTHDFWGDGTLMIYWDTVNGLLVSALILSFYQHRGAVLSSKVFTQLGKISYGIYLWHLPLINVFRSEFKSFLQLSMVVLPLTILLASLSYYLVERRFMKGTT